jgi:hypothetical protein
MNCYSAAYQPATPLGDGQLVGLDAEPLPYLFFAHLRLPRLASFPLSQRPLRHTRTTIISNSR